MSTTVTKEIYRKCFNRVKSNIETYKIFERERLIDEIGCELKVNGVECINAAMKNEIYTQIKKEYFNKEIKYERLRTT